MVGLLSQGKGDDEAIDEGNHLIDLIRAKNLIHTLNQPVITPQIINEVSVNLLRKRQWTEQELRQLIGELRVRCRLFLPSEDWCQQASVLRERYGFSFWDSLVVASAQAGCCDIRWLMGGEEAAGRHAAER